MIIELNITVDNASNINTQALLSQIEAVLAEVNGESSSINIVDTDDPISQNPLNYRVGV